MSKYLFVKYNDNWADEMDITGFVIVTAEHWKEIKDDVQKFFRQKMSWEFGVGTNEQIEYESFEAWSRTLTVTELSDAEYSAFMDVFKRLKIRAGYDETRFIVEEGFFPMPTEDEFDSESDDDDDDEDGEDEDADEENDDNN